MDTKNYTPVARSKIHTCAKFGVDCLNGATCIVNITDKQTDKQTDKWNGNRRLRTCQNFQNDDQSDDDVDINVNDQKDFEIQYSYKDTANNNDSFTNTCVTLSRVLVSLQYTGIKEEEF